MHAASRIRSASITTRGGFTLFEVAIAMLLVSFCVTSVLLIFPSGLRQLEIDRFRIYAAAMANQLVDVYGTADAGCIWTDTEAPRIWDLPIDRRINAPDLEAKCATHRFGLMPLPQAIARRLDSAGDEIAAILDAGGDIYYLQPNIPDVTRQDVLPAAPPNDLQKLVVGIVGSAQHNASFSHPMKRWPYYASVPGPPFHSVRSDTWWNGTSEPGKRPAHVGDGGFCWQSMGDDGIGKVWNAFRGYRDCANGGGTLSRRTDEVCSRLGAYIQAADAYAFTAPVTDEDLAWFLEEHRPLRSRFLADPPAVAARKVLALNYLTHALQSLTRWHKLDPSIDAGKKAIAGLADTQGVDVAQDYAGGGTLALRLPLMTHSRLVHLAENCRFEYYRFTAANPYNWAVPRPIEHATMMDFGLLELDMFAPPLAGAITLAPAGIPQARQWRYLAPQPITSLASDPYAPFGADLSYPTMSKAIIRDSFQENGPTAGSTSHYTLLRPFTASERCRELVFWVVDWQQYEDCETAPSAPLDASRYPKSAPAAANHGFDDLMQGWNHAIADPHMPTYRNPEKNLVFLRPTSGLETGHPMGDKDLFQQGVYGPQPDFGPPGKGGSCVEVFNGLYGADRNGNRQLDRGPLPRSARLRAQQVARVMYYDARVPVKIR